MLQLHTRAATLPNYVSSAEELTAVGLRLMRAEYPLTLRLIGIRCCGTKDCMRCNPCTRNRY